MQTEYALQTYEDCVMEGTRDIFEFLSNNYSATGKYIFYSDHKGEYLPEILAMLLIAGLDLKIYFNFSKIMKLEIYVKNNKKRGVIRKVDFGLSFAKAKKYRRKVEEIVNNKIKYKTLEETLSVILKEVEEN